MRAQSSHPAKDTADFTSLALELTRGNHFKFGYNGQWFAERRSEHDIWAVCYGRCDRAVQDWRAECIETARAIRDSTRLDLWVLFSGGIDSEVVLQSFLFASLPITAAITCFRNDLNRQDVRYAIKFCETHQVPYRLLHLDIERFFETGEALDLAVRTKCVQPQLLHTMWAMDQVDGYPILGSAECYLESNLADPPVWEMLEKERIASWYRHLIVRNREGCAGFFQFTPEVMLAFLVDPTVMTLCTGGYPVEKNTMRLKPSIYRKYFLLESRPKFTGFENVLHLDDALRPELERRFGAYDGIARTPYSELVALLTPAA